MQPKKWSRIFAFLLALMLLLSFSGPAYAAGFTVGKPTKEKADSFMDAFKKFSDDLSALVEQNKDSKSYIKKSKGDPSDKKGKSLLNLDQLNLDKLNLDQLNLDKSNLDKLNLDKSGLDKLNLDKANLDKLNIEKPDLDKLKLDKSKLNNINKDSLPLDKLNLDKLNLNQLNLDHLFDSGKASSKTPAKSPPMRGGNEPEFVIDANGLLTKWNKPLGFTGVLTIPDNVITIDAHVFQNKGIKEVNMGKNVQKIGKYAFSDNEINKINFDPANQVLGEIEEGAFRNNLLKDLTLPDTVKTIGISSFRNNKLQTLNLGKVERIDDEAFRNNDLVEVNIPDTVTFFGQNVFLDNNRYVKIITKNNIVKSVTTPDHFGYIVNPVQIKVNFIDKATGQKLIASKILGNDLSNPGEVFEAGVEQTYIPEKIFGYMPEEDEYVFTPEVSENEYYELTINYTKCKEPTLEIGTISLAQNETVDKAKLLSYVELARDARGKDLKDKVTVSPETVDTSHIGTLTVYYSVTDASGMSKTVAAPVTVVANGPAVEVGGGWTVGDFIFSKSGTGAVDNNDGNYVVGFSAAGLEKLKTNKNLYLPQTNYAGKPVNAVGQGAFYGSSIESLVIPAEVKTIESAAFASSMNLKNVVANGVEKIVVGEKPQDDNGTFTNQNNQVVKQNEGAFTKCSQLDLVSFPSLNNINENRTFQSCTSLKTANLPALRTLEGNSTFNSCSALTRLDFPKLEAITGNETFKGCIALETTDFPKLKTIIGDSTFKFTYPEEPALKALSFPALTEISGGNTFDGLIQLETLTMPVLNKIENGGSTFAETKLTEVNFPALTKMEGGNLFESCYKLETVTLPALTEIANSNLFNFCGKLTTLNLPALERISGNNVFYSCKMLPKRLDFPKLKEITGKDILRNTGQYGSIGNFFEIYGDPSVAMECRENWVLNPKTDPSLGTEITDEDIRWKDKNAGIMEGLTNTGMMKLNNAGGHLVLPSTVKSFSEKTFFDWTLLKSIKGDGVEKIEANSVFESCKNLTSVSFPSLKKINGLDVFKNAKDLTTVSLPALQSVSSAGDPFGGNLFYGCSALTEVSFPALTTIIGNSTFGECQSLTKASLPALKSIVGNKTFYMDQKLSEVDLSSLESLLGDQTFYDCQALTKLSFPALQSLGDASHSGEQSFANCNHLKVLETPNLKTVYGENLFPGDAGGPVPLEKWVISDALMNETYKAEHPGDFSKMLDSLMYKNDGSWTYPPNKCIIYTVNRTNPNGFNGETDRYILNPSQITFHYINEEGEELYPSKTVEVGMENSYTPAFYPEIPGYKTPPIQSVDLSGNPPKIDVQVIYHKYTESDINTYNERTGKIGFRQYYQQPGVEKYKIGDPMTSRVSFKISGYAAELSGGKIKIYFDTDVVDPSNISWDKPDLVDSIDVDQEKGVLTVNLKNMQGGDDIDFPITWHFKKFVTPQDTPYPWVAKIFGNNGDLFTIADPLTFTGYYNNPVFQKKHPGGFYGYVETTEFDQDGGLKREEKLIYTFDLSQLERNIGEFEITDILPTYTNKEGQLLTAEFVPEENPLWVLSADKKTVTYIGDAKNSTDLEMPALVLRVPGAREFANIQNTAKLRLHPYGATQYEKDMNLAARAVHYYCRPLASGEIIKKKISMPHMSPIEGQAYFYDVNQERNLEFQWNIYFNFDGTKIEKNDRAEWKIKDFNLDNRMYYTGIEVPDFLRGAKISLYENNTKLYEQILDNSDRFTIPEPLQRRVSSIALSQKNGLENLTMTRFSVYTKLRDPDALRFDETPNSTGNEFPNELQVDVVQKSGNTQTYSDRDSLALRKFDQIVKVSKDTTFRNDAGPNNPLKPGESGSYLLRVQKVSDLIEEPLKDFELIDLLPKGLGIKEITLSDEFKQSVTHRCEIQENYMGTGQTAVIFRSDNLALSYPERILVKGAYGEFSNIAEIKVQIDETVAEGDLKNEAFLWISNQKVTLANPEADPRLGPKEWSKDSVTRPVVRAKQLIGRKYISKDKNYWSKEGIVTDSLDPFWYKLSVINNTDHERKNNVIIDILPFNGDTAMVEDQQGNRVPRGSEFSNTFDPARAVEVPPGYQIKYLNEQVPPFTGKLEDAEGTWNWQDQPSQATTAIKVSAENNTSLGSQESLDILIPMKAPDNQALSLSGKRAYNTFARKDDITTSFLEPNRVYNEMSTPTGTVSLTKKGWKSLTEKVNLQGAVFGLWDQAGNFIEQKETDVNGQLSFTISDLSKDYEIREIKAPDGYKKIDQVYPVKGADLLARPGYQIDLGEIIDPKSWTPLEPIKGNLKLHKVDKENAPLVAVCFHLQGLDKWNKYIDRKGWTDQNGDLTFEDLEHGQYRLTEIPYNSLTPMSEKTVSIHQGENSLPENGGTITNDKGRLHLVKLGILDDKSGKPVINLGPSDGITGSELQGAKFELYQGTVKVADLTADAQGEIIYDNLDLDTVYTLRETTAPAGYDTYQGDINFKIDKTGRLLTAGGENFPTNNLYVPDLRTKLKSIVIVTKKDENGNLLAGAKFGLYKKNNNNEFELIDQETADVNGKAQFVDLSGGIYQLKEETAPLGYFLSNEVKTFTVDDYQTKTFEYEYTDKILKQRIRKISYLGKNLTEEQANNIIASEPSAVKEKNGDFYDVYLPLAGVTFKLKDSASSQILGTYTTGQDGILPIDPMTLDTSKNYELIETQAPNGYEPKISPILLNLKDQSLLTGFDGTFNITIENRPIKGRITVSKFKNKDKEPLAGVTFALMDENEEIIKTAISDNSGDAHFDDLPLGTYKIKETKVPSGYVLNSEVKTVVLDNEDRVKFVSFYNDSVELPSSGLHKNQIVFLFMTALLTGGAYLLSSKRTNKFFDLS